MSRLSEAFERDRSAGRSSSFRQRSRPKGPGVAGISIERLARMDKVIEQAIEKRNYPACSSGWSSRCIVWRKAYGARAVEPQREAMTADTIFDLASLTKVVVTATSIMMLIERGEVRLSRSGREVHPGE